MQKKYHKLSIQFSLDGFSFCVINQQEETTFFKKIDFENTLNSAEELLEKIELSFKEIKELQEDFREIVAVHENNLSTLVPSEYFDKNHLKTYLDYNIKTLATDFFAFDKIKNTEIHNVYVPYVNINNFLFQHFGEFEFKHHLTVLVEKLLAVKCQENANLFVNVSESSLDIIYIKEEQLLFANSFHYNTKEDFTYYLLFVIEQLKLDTNKIQLYLVGDIYKESELYNMIYLYINKVSFLMSDNAIFKELNIGRHTNYILLG